MIMVFARWQKTVREWREAACLYDTDDAGRAWLACESILSEIAGDVSPELFAAWRNVCLAFGIIGFDSFNDGNKEQVLLSVHRWQSLLGSESIELTAGQAELLEQVLTAADIPLLIAQRVFAFSEVASKQPEGFSEVVQGYEDCLAEFGDSWVKVNKSQ